MIEEVKNMGEAISLTPSGDLNSDIEGLVKNHPIILFMKGNPSMPRCGFSANTINILNLLSRPYFTFDILQNMDIRQGLKDYSDWGTYPQLYVNGKFIGGNDIITQMYQTGELQKMNGISLLILIKNKKIIMN